jgi:hypothetical protein
MGAGRVKFTGTESVELRHDGVPRKVRMQQRYIHAAEGARRRMRTRVVDTEAVRHFIEATDLDYPRDGQVDAHDIAIFAHKARVTAPSEGWEKRCERMVQECLERTGYGNSGMPSEDPPVISAPDIVAACRFRYRADKQVVCRPFRDDWVALLEAANEGKVFLPPEVADVCHAPPLLTDRERRVVEATMPKIASILGGRRTTRELRGNGGDALSNAAFAALFGGVADATKPLPKRAPRFSETRTRADGVLGDSHHATANYKSAKLISEMTSAQAFSSEGEAPASPESGPAPAPRTPVIDFAARASYEDLKQQIIKGASEYKEDTPKKAKGPEERPPMLGPGEPFVRDGTWTQPIWNPSQNYHDRMVFPPMFHEREPMHVAVRVKPGSLEESTVMTAPPDFRVPVRAGKTKRAHNLYMSSLEARRTFLGKAEQAFYELDEAPPYRHTYRASDPYGWDRRSRIVAEQRKKELKKEFVGRFARKPKERNNSVLGDPDVNYAAIIGAASLQYDRLAVHPKLDPDDPGVRAF